MFKFTQQEEMYICLLTWDFLIERATGQLYFSISIDSVPPPPPPCGPTPPPDFSLSIYWWVNGFCGLWRICRCVSFIFSLPVSSLPSLSRALPSRWSRRSVEVIWCTLCFFLLLPQWFEAKKHPDVSLFETGDLTGFAVALLRGHGLRSVDNGSLRWRHLKRSWLLCLNNAVWVLGVWVIWAQKSVSQTL